MVLVRISLRTHCVPAVARIFLCRFCPVHTTLLEVRQTVESFGSPLTMFHRFKVGILNTDNRFIGHVGPERCTGGSSPPSGRTSTRTFVLTMSLMKTDAWGPIVAAGNTNHSSTWAKPNLVVNLRTPWPYLGCSGLPQYEYYLVRSFSAVGMKFN
jgi:hypothetical protein